MKWHFYDWDDTILLTRYAIFLSYKFALEKIKGIDLTELEFNKLYANSNGYMAEHGFTSDEILQVKELKNYVYLNKYWQHIQILKKKFPTDETHIIVSNTTQDVIHLLLEKFKMTEYFSQVVGSDAYTGASRKPSPDLYNFAFSQIQDKFNTEEDELVIHEDSEFGLNAALSFHEAHKDTVKHFKIIYTPLHFNIGSYI